MERKTLKFEVKDIDESDGTFTGYASTFTSVPDSYGDVVDKGCFTKTIKENKGRIKILWNHSVMEPIGKPVEMYEDDTGLLVKGKLTLGVQRAKETLALMKDGVINEMSIGYDTITEQIVKGVRHLKEVKLYDVSPVTFAANPSALILDVKAVEHAISTNDIEPVKEAVKALQALLEKCEVEEPSPGTPEPEIEPEAAKLDEAIDALLTIPDFDASEAGRKLDEMLATIK